MTALTTTITTNNSNIKSEYTTGQHNANKLPPGKCIYSNDVFSLFFS